MKFTSGIVRIVVFARSLRRRPDEVAPELVVEVNEMVAGSVFGGVKFDIVAFVGVEFVGCEYVVRSECSGTCITAHSSSSKHAVPFPYQPRLHVQK